MKTNSNNNATPSGLTPPDSNPVLRRYCVTVARNDYLFCRIEVDAINEGEAKTIAMGIAAEQDDDAWDTGDSDLQAFEVEEIEQGGSHE